MVGKQAALPAVVDDAEVMSSIDIAGTAERLIIADVTRDDAWLSTAVADAVPVAERR